MFFWFMPNLSSFIDSSAVVFYKNREQSERNNWKFCEALQNMKHLPYFKAYNLWDISEHQ